MDFPPKTNKIEIRVESKNGRPRDQPEDCEIETVAKSPESALYFEDGSTAFKIHKIPD